MTMIEVTSKDPHHFFATSVAGYKTSASLDEVISTMKYDNIPFSVWLVPLPLESCYSIENFVPQVDESISLTTYEYDMVADTWFDHV
jgi:hypothetical protein